MCINLNQFKHKRKQSLLGSYKKQQQRNWTANFVLYTFKKKLFHFVCLQAALYFRIKITFFQFVDFIYLFIMYVLI